MNLDRKLPAPPPRGLILIGDKWEIRRFGLLVQRQLTCIFGHRIKLGDERPFEIAVPCGHMEQRDAQVRCDARIYLFVTRPRLVWAMDVTTAETLTIMQHSMDTEEIVEYFGVGFPTDIKITRPPESVAQKAKPA